MPTALYKPKSDENRFHAASKKSGDARNAYRRDLARLIHSPCFRRLEGKAQLFPSDENDFFRNRLTHSLEVAQIATGIALNLNASQACLKSNPINVDLVHFAALAHDIGHPPFGHDGERALDMLMREHGGFEGNAQTFRILARLEKKDGVGGVVDAAGNDIRTGLALTYRSLASILKYDEIIPWIRATNATVRKGYYATEATLIESIKSSIAPDTPAGKFKTIECSIMDLADDIAYSTYDLEDAFKSGFLSPLSMAAAPDETKHRIADVVNKKMKDYYPEDVYADEQLAIEGIDRIILSIFDAIFQPSQEFAAMIAARDRPPEELSYAASAQIMAASELLREDGNIRSAFTSQLVHAFMSNIKLEWNKQRPALSFVQLTPGAFQTIEVLKRFSYESLIMSNRFKMVDRRGKEIIERIFQALSEYGGDRIMPEDVRRAFLANGKSYLAVSQYLRFHSEYDRSLLRGVLFSPNRQHGSDHL